MSEYGIKIKNYKAGSIYGYNLGIRKAYDYKDAMLSNSLFSDFLKENGLNVWKGVSTRDVICIDFDYGTRSYEEELKHLTKRKENLNDSEKIKRIDELIQFAKENQYKYIKKSAEEIREEFYQKGVPITYQTYNKKGILEKEETIFYKMLYRTPGKAKKGSCMFINEKLYDVARNYLYMGIQLPYHNSPVVEIGAYSSLITSSIVGKIEINPRNILVLNDVDSFFETNVISIETDENKRCQAVYKEKYKLKNTLFDGQALIDTSIFPDWADGYVLLRQRFCKMAAFHTNIQGFFKDYFGEYYETATVLDMFGTEHYVKDIQLITTDNALKWLKFDVSYDYWCEKVSEGNNLFGIVKTAHASKLGEVQRMSYQMVNALSVETMNNVLKTSVDYICKLKTDDTVFLDYLKKNINFSNDYEALIALCEHNKDFTKSEYFRERRSKIISNYVLNLKNGKLIQNADNLVIVGSPYAMLLYSVGEAPENDDTFCCESGAIQCFTERFADGEYLAEFRSPFNSRNNLGYLHNVYSEKMFKYFNFGKQIIAVNMIGTAMQDRNNGLI